MQLLLLGHRSALKVRIGCIVRCTPEGHVCYLFSAFKLHRPLPRFSCRDAGPTRHSEKKILCLSKNEPSDCGRLSLSSGSTRKCTIHPEKRSFSPFH